MHTWFGPNVASADLREMAAQPARWTHARQGTAYLQLYAQMIGADAPGQHGVGPNDYASLINGGVLNQLDRWRLPLAIECSAVKEWSPSGREAFEHLRDVVIPRVQTHTSQLGAILLDEPRVAGQSLGQSIEETAGHTARFITGVRDLGFHLEVGLIEAYPYLKMAEILRFVELCQASGGGPASVHLDVDRFGLRDQRISDAEAQAELRRCHQRCVEWEIPMGIILFGQRATSEGEYAHGSSRHGTVSAGALQWAQTAHRWVPTVERLIVQSWEERGPGGAKDLPRNLPDSDPLSHTGIVRAVRGVWA